MSKRSVMPPRRDPRRKSGRNPVNGAGGKVREGDIRTRAFNRKATARDAGTPQDNSPGTALKRLLRPAFIAFRSVRVPRAALVCALVAFLNAVCWSIVTPPFQVPDEPAHFAFVKFLAETGSLPTSSSQQWSREEIFVLKFLHFNEVRQEPSVHTLSTVAEQSELDRVLKEISSGAQAQRPNAGTASNEPPLYYALEAIPYELASGGSMLDRLQLMRLMSALFAALTALFVFLFVREMLPGKPWAWTVSGLCIAVSPLLGFMSGAINPDSMLCAVSAGLFFTLARSFRRGFSTRGAVAIGILIATGFMTKLNFVGLVPGIIVGLIVLSRRIARTSRRQALRRCAIAFSIGLSPVFVYGLVNILSNHSLFGIVSAAIQHESGSILGKLNYAWQLYLPHLPGTTNDFPGINTTRELWFNGYVGLYGWLDTKMPELVNQVAIMPAVALVILCGRSVVAGRSALRSRLVEPAVYASIGLGLPLLIAVNSYHAFPVAGSEYAQVRYLLPLLSLLGAFLALAVRGAGRRWGPAVGALVVVMFLAHDIFSQLQVVARFYG